MDRAENTQKIYEQVAKASSKIKAIKKEQYNEGQKFKYRGIDDVYNELHPILCEYNLFTVPSVLEDRTEERKSRQGSNLIYRVLKVSYRMFADDGSYIDGTVIGEGMDSGDKAANKAMAVAHKYFLSQLFTIPTGDDPDGDSPPPTTKKTPPGSASQTSSTKNTEDIKCSVCGETMRLSDNKTQKGATYYYCSAYKNGCNNKGTRKSNSC